MERLGQFSALKLKHWQPEGEKGEINEQLISGKKWKRSQPSCVK